MAKWVLIADASRARLFVEERPDRPFTLLDSWEHPQSRARVRELMADAAGRKPAGMSRGDGPVTPGGAAARPGAAPDTDPKWVEAQKLARDLADRLAQGLHSHAYEHLVIAAPPQFLGLLKHELSHEVSKHLELALNKDLTQHERPEIEAQIRRELGA